MNMDALCNQLTSCYIKQKPKLYDMMIYDFKELSNQYSTNELEYSFDMKPEYNYLSFQDVQELLIYLQKNNVEKILICIIQETYPSINIDHRTIESMIDYYIDCISMTT